MTRLFTDGAEFGDLASFSVIEQPLTVSTAVVRSGVYSYLFDYWGRANISLPSDCSEFFFRGAFYFTNFDTSNGGYIVRFRKDTTDLLSLRIANLGGIKVCGYVGATNVVTGSIIVVNTWYLIECHIIISDTGTFELKIDGVAATPFSGDTKPDSNTVVNSLWFFQSGGIKCYVDDLGFNDSSNSNGKGDNSWCGEGKIELLSPNGNGSLNEWTGSDSNSTDNYLLVDELPPSSSDYVENATAGQKDKYTLADFTGTNKQILRVVPVVYALDTVPEGAQIKVGVRTNSTDYMSAAKTLSASYSRVYGEDYKVNPDDSAAWEDADLDGLELVLETV